MSNYVWPEGDIVRIYMTVVTHRHKPIIMRVALTRSQYEQIARSYGKLEDCTVHLFEMGSDTGAVWTETEVVGHDQ